jgi:hypothetical protein
MEYRKPNRKQEAYASDDDVNNAQEVVFAAYPGCGAQHEFLQPNTYAFEDRVG